MKKQSLLLLRWLFAMVVMMKVVFDFTSSSRLVRAMKAQREGSMEIQTIFYSHRFNTCWNVSEYMTRATSFLREMGNERWIPDEFGCSNISLWTKYGVQPVIARSGQEIVWYYSFVIFENIGQSYDVCKKVRKWEEALKLSCDSLFCDMNSNVSIDLATYIERETQYSTTIYDWINYCQYCTNERTLRSYKHISFKASNLKTCTPKDEKVSEMLNQYPSSITYCGNYQFGIPFIINSTAVEPNALYGNYSYICYCIDGNYFALKCDNNLSNFAARQAIGAITCTLHGLSLLLAFFSTFIPKIRTCIKQKKIMNSVTITSVVLSEFVLTTASIFEISYSTSVPSTVIINTGIAMVFASLFTWVLRWVALVLFIKTKSNKVAAVLYCLLAILFILVGIALPITMTLFGDLQSIIRFFSIYSTAMSGSTGFLFAISSAWIYWAMKQVSDVDIFNSSFLKYVGLFTVSSALFSLCYMTISSTPGAFFNGLLSGVVSIVVHSSLVAISNGLTYSEFEKEDFNDCWNCLRVIKVKRGNRQQTTTSSITDTNSSYYSRLMPSEDAN
ncbi:hypothetical protein C9374_005245 [Naegleria lovaniensis]|uniref:Uncharacterized protein n=1 Tax=Naegleria lovaniensis TaxID=51637 RepID=A0AA88GRB8_NAELO|nr:uncharacterized protein C9374_005245 [Naegleria lovaniensis]KAG2382665.1 hypothetical protein C9374_005245 [Naegleria lovaniensis]